MEFSIRRSKNKTEFIKLLNIRKKVFVDELNVPLKLEFDGLDESSTHFIVLFKNHIIGTARLVISKNEGKIGRVCILREYRKIGLGNKLVKSIIKFAKRIGLKELSVESKVSALTFYEKFGFIEKGKEFVEAGIPHKKMFLKI